MAQSKNRLGRGLGSLISGGAPAKKTAAPKSGNSSTTAGKKAAGKVARASAKRARPEEALDATTAASLAPAEQPYREVPVAGIKPNPYQPRREIDPERVRALAESIRSEGLLQPIVVRQKDGHFELIAGERRWRAHQQLGLKTIPARIIEAGDASSAVISLIENLQRESLNPVEEALGYASLMRDFDLTQEAVSERVGRGRATVANALRLLSLDREIQGYLAKGMLSSGHAKVLLSLEDGAQRLLLARRILDRGMSVREAERQIKQMKSGGDTRRSPRRSQEAEQAVIRDYEKQLGSRLNTPVSLKHSPKKGRIVIEYFGNDDLQRILEKLGLE